MGATSVLCGGDKRTQDADIRRAIQLAEIWRKQVKSRSAASPKASKKR